MTRLVHLVEERNTEQQFFKPMHDSVEEEFLGDKTNSEEKGEEDDKNESCRYERDHLLVRKDPKSFLEKAESGQCDMSQSQKWLCTQVDENQENPRRNGQRQNDSKTGNKPLFQELPHYF